jgi:hypothetical protein
VSANGNGAAAFAVAATIPLDLKHVIVTPATGGTPTGYVNIPQYSGPVEWSNASGPFNGNFKTGEIYTAVATLTAGTGFTFAGKSFVYTGASSVTPTNGSDDSVTVTIVFPAIPVTVMELDLTAWLDAPKKGATPDDSIEAPQYTATGSAVAWTETGGGEVSGVFTDGTEYTATVTLTAASGLTFTGVGNFIHKGTTKISQQDNDGSSITVIIEFPAPPVAGGGW